ncbi:peptidoglycan DD-metalloendopeptidase family protein [bacterium]|nr:peptidoglycan DD-metalloendopeptidase family protein [bacterium]
MRKIQALLVFVFVSVFVSAPARAELGRHLASLDAPVLQTGAEVYSYSLPRNSTFYQALRELEFSPQEIRSIVQVADDHMDLSKLLPATKFDLVYAQKPLDRIVEIGYSLEPAKRLRLKRGADSSWVAQVDLLETQTRVLSFTGRVNSSLWESAIYAGMDPVLVAEMASIFAWQIDFSREVQKGDRWRIMVEELLIEGKPAGWGDILAAEYDHQGEIHTGVLLRSSESGELGYFTPEGKSLRRMFLKAPIKFGRISSRFQKRRFHPILKTHRPHLGVDYAAPRGTPVMAVGDGVVTRASSMGGAGNTIKLRHNSMYMTHYKHLKSFAKGVRAGKKVRQGQIIGYVGSTGLSTGPHLHFELWENGRYVDPLGKKFPSSDPVPTKYLKTFVSQAKSWLGYLPKWIEEKDEAPTGPLYVSIEHRASL